MSYKLSGTVKLIGDITIVSEKFKKREIVITDDQNSLYPQHIAFQVSNHKCDLFENISPGDQVEVSFNIRGREWANPTTGEVKHFNTIEIWSASLKHVPDQHNYRAEQQPQHSMAQPGDQQQATPEEPDGLPF